MTQNNDTYHSPCSGCFFVYLFAVSVSIVGALIYVSTKAAWPLLPQLGQFCGGALIISAFIVALAWALRRK